MEAKKKRNIRLIVKYTTLSVLYILMVIVGNVLWVMWINALTAWGILK